MSKPLIVANNGAKVHVVEIKGTKLQKYSLEQGQVGVYELDGLEPGRYTLRCIVSGHREQAVLTVPRACPAALRAPVGSRSVHLAVPTGTRGDAGSGLTASDYGEIIDALNDATDARRPWASICPPGIAHGFATRRRRSRRRSSADAG